MATFNIPFKRFVVARSSVLKNVLSRSEEFTSSVNFEADFSKRFDGGLGEFMPDKMEEMKDDGAGTVDHVDGDEPVDITDENASDVKADELTRADAADGIRNKKKNMKEEMFEIQNM